MVDMRKLNTAISILFFYLMTTTTFIFNFNANSLLGIPAYIWTNVFIIVFIGWEFLQCIASGGKLYIDKIFHFVIAFIVLTGISCIYSYNRTDTFDKLRTMAMMFIIAISIYQFVIDSDNLRLALISYSWSGFSMAVFLFTQSASLNNRIGNIIGDTNLIGITFAFTATVAIHLFKTERRFKVIYLIQIITIAVAIMMTGSRTSFLLLLLTVISNIYLSAYQNKWKIRYVILATIGLIAAVCALLYLVMNNALLYSILGMRIQSFFEIINGEQSNYGETSTQVRGVYAQRAFLWFLESPIFGHGLGTFHSYNITCSPYGRNCFSHCEYTEILSALGVLGFIAYFSPFIKFVKRIFSKSYETLTRQYNILMGSLTIQFLIGGIGLVMYYEKGTWILFALLAGMYKNSIDNDIFNTTSVCESDD